MIKIVAFQKAEKIKNTIPDANNFFAVCLLKVVLWMYKQICGTQRCA